MIERIYEVLLTAGHCMKLIFAGKQTIVLVVSGFVLLTAMLWNMEEVKEEKSKIAIGIVDQSKSELSARVINEMQNNELYEVSVGEEEALVERLKGGELAAVCVFKSNLVNNIAKGRTRNLFTIYETDKESALLFSDILAGLLMQDICAAKGYQMLQKYREKAGKEDTLSAKEYEAYIKDIMVQEEVDFSFDITYLNTKNEETRKPSQTVLYQQAIFATFALMLGVVSIYAVLPFQRICHDSPAKRIHALPIHKSSLFLGSALAALILTAGFGIMFLLCLSLKNPVSFSEILSLLVCTIVYICVIVCMMLCVAYGVRSHSVYQMGMLAMILLFGVFGFVSVVDGLLLPEGMATRLPNGWYVRKMTELFHN